MYAIAFKLLQCHYVTLYNKFDNSELNTNEIIAPFDLEISVKPFHNCQ